MATNLKPTSTKSKSKMIVFAIEIIVILAMLAILYLVLNRKPEEQPLVTVLDEEEIKPDNKVQQEIENGTSKMLGYKNIALFGVDALSREQITKNSRSDSIMIASINMDNGDIKLVSVYRDSYLNIGTDSYQKCNAAYAKGGAEQAVKMLNNNLDLYIKDFVAVGYNAVIDLIDGLGGIYIDVDKEELKYINDYQVSIVAAWKYGLNITESTPPEAFNVVKSSDYVKLTEPGYQLLNGLQATAYCRIRYTAGSDYKRTERQREGLKAIETQAKKMNVADLTKIFNKVIGNVYTNISTEDLLALLEKIADYQIVDEDGFPQADLRTAGPIGAKGDCVVPRDLVKNVVWLHEFLFEEQNYEVSDTVKEYSEKIKSDTDRYFGN